MKDYLKSKLEINHGSHDPMYAMEGLRGLAVFMVFLVHYSSLVEHHLNSFQATISSNIGFLGNLGVDLFFIFSGYLIYAGLINKQKINGLKYSKNRIRRIYPTFLVVLLIYISLSIIFPEQSKFPNGLLNKAVYLLQNIFLLPGIFPIDPIITVAWSLSYEVFYYLIVPLVIIILRLRSVNIETRIYIWIFIAITGFVISLINDTHIRLLLFVSGIILYEFRNIDSHKNVNGGILVYLACIALFMFKDRLGLNNTISYSVLFIGFMYFTYACLSNKTIENKIFSYRPARWLGNMSYSYYLIHGLSLHFIFLIVEKAFPNVKLDYFLFMIPCFIFSLIVSFILYIWVEKPYSIDVRNKR